MQKNKRVFAFDVGIGSLGLAVREGNEIVHGDSLLIDPDVGSLKDERGRRRAYRTRKAHKNREKTLEKLWIKIGEKPLYGDSVELRNGEWQEIKGDEKLKREFPDREDETVYTSCLLRIMLLEGQKLETWQIFKAIRSALQRRGYDDKVPWKNAKDQKEKGEIKKRINEFQEKLEKISNDPRHYYSCYYDAHCMGLWENSNIVSIRLNPKETRPETARGYVAPRKMVDEEIRTLLKQAAQQLPKLAAEIDSEEKLSTLLYGERSERLLSDDRRYPSAKQHDGLLAQKLPRFNNRAVGNCCLIPRFHVCKKSEELFIRVSFLLKLINFRYLRIDANTGELTTISFTPEQLKEFYQEKTNRWEKEEEKSPEKCTKIFRWIKTETKKHIKALNGMIKSGHEKIESLENTGGRCRYSRPALAIIHELILQGRWEEPGLFRKNLLESAQPVTEKNKKERRRQRMVMEICGLKLVTDASVSLKKN